MPESKNKLMEKQSSEYLRMSELLKKERPPDAIVLVRKVLDSGCSLDEKIRRIEAIDAQDIVRDIEESGITDSEAQRIIRRQRVFTRDTAERNIDRIKAKSFRTPYFLFIMRDFLPIREFGKRTGVVSTRIFPPTVGVNYPEYRDFMTQLKKEAEELLPILKFVMEKGWMYLDKLDYNLIGIFNILCEIIKSFKVPQGRKDAGLILERMKSVEAYFLACHYQAEFTEIILNGIRVVLGKENRHKSHVDLSDYLVKKILFANRTSYCLFNLVVGMNMARLRKHIRLEDLIHYEPGGVVNTFDYDGSSKVKERIAVFINDQVHVWRSLCREKAEVGKINLFLKQYARADENGFRSYDFRLIGEFYDFHRGSAGTEQFHFSRDQDNVAHTASNFFNLYLADVENFLTGMVELETFGNTQVFKQDFFQFEIDQIRRYALKLSETVYSCPYLSYREFQNFKKSEREKNPSSAQVAVIQCIDALADTAVDIGKKTSAVCQKQNKNMSWSPEEQTVPQPIEIGMLRMAEIRSPMFNKTVMSPGYLKDRSVIDSLCAISSLSFLAGLYFFNPKLSAILYREFRINEGILETRHSLERIADAVTFEKIRLLDDIASS